MTWADDIQREPWVFDFYAALRRLERALKDKPKIGLNLTIRDEVVRLGQNPFMQFPASTLEEATRDEAGHFHIMVKFLGLLGPQGALPLSTTSEAYEWFLARDDAFPRFLDIFNNRFLQLFYRAWADSRPIAQHERPQEDRFGAYIGSTIGLGTQTYLDLDAIPDLQKLAFAGLMAPAAKSAVRLETLILGAIGLRAEVEEFVGSRLPVAPEDQSRLGLANFSLGTDLMVGSSVYSVSDKITVSIRVADLDEYARVLPGGDLAEPLVDLVYFYVGDVTEWDVELVIPANKVKPMRLGSFGALGLTTWLDPKIDPADTGERRDARFNLYERMRAVRAKQAEA